MSTGHKRGDADLEHGYVFGCDGLMGVSEVCDHLSIGRATLDRLVVRGALRKGKDGETGRVSICKRSVMEYVRGMEV
ncbi:MerR family transcriptional regulator [Planctomicrobium piriforme]|uniref:Helix-turn-helix domain-containing protein n=1 Tax=Planctomicrobium piriforme TaxID=1576369 RepID=A0A1I3Q0I1_9PLAN|nr:helix-turn-helix domain-containing protein [Planctomicrobium piriforme]SFJ27219.1 hypothetical protein SAMN05421753_11798 [Planctomicrobium piriforme]